MIVCINYSALYRIMCSYDTDVQMITSSHDLVIIFLNCRCREHFNCLPPHFKGSPESFLTGSGQALSLCSCVKSTFFFACDVDLGGSFF